LFSRPEKIVNLLSAILVLVAGFYAIFFLPVKISPAARILLALALILYFLIRIRYYIRQSRRADNRNVIDTVDHNKSLDKNGI
jgi:chromate transport protein ChrA